MSLINEALKNAQRESQGDSAPAVRDTHLTEAALKGASKSRALPLLLAVILVAGGAAAWYFLSSGEVPPAPAVATKPAEPVAKAPAPTVPPEPVTAVEPVKPAEPVAVTPEPVKPAEPVVAQVEPVKPAVIEPPKPVENAEVRALVDSYRVTLARKSTGRAVVNGTVVKVGEVVTQAPYVALKEITDVSVIFCDAAGVGYEKRYK